VEVEQNPVDNAAASSIVLPTVISIFCKETLGEKQQKTSYICVS